MTREEIITKIYNERLVHTIAITYLFSIGVDDYDDFVAEIITILCEMEEKKLCGMYERGELEWYIISICRNQARNPNSAFNKKYHREQEITGVKFIDDENTEEFE